MKAGFRSHRVMVSIPDDASPGVSIPAAKGCGADGEVGRRWVSIPVSRTRAAIWITDGPGGFDPGLPSDPDYRPLSKVVPTGGGIPGFRSPVLCFALHSLGFDP